MSDFVPADVLIDVLSRLPIKTLVRCACVCKSWYSLVTNPSSITTLANNNKNNLLLVRSRSGDEAEVVHYSLLRCENGMFCDYAELELPLRCDGNPHLTIIGSCNGLVCLSKDLHTYWEELYLWNPSIRKTMALPPLRVTFESHGAYKHIIGFGFDSQKDDYKVVRIVYLEERDGFFGFGPPPEVDIFSLSTGTWRNISHLGLPYTIDERAPQAYLNGAAHWTAHDWGRGRRGNLIVSFNMGAEVFDEIMMPSSMVCDFWVGHIGVAKFQESLSLIVGVWGKPCCIWVMKEYGISDSWTKQFSIDVSVGFTSVVGFTRKDEVLLELESGFLVAYDPEGERAMDLHIRGSYADAYIESLVLFRANFHDPVTCKESPVLHGEMSGAKKSGAKKSRKRRAKPRKKGKNRSGDQGGKLLFGPCPLFGRSSMKYLLIKKKGGKSK